MNEEKEFGEVKVKKTPPAPVKRTTVRVIRHTGSVILVSYVEDGAEKRRTVPAPTLDPDGTISEKDLAAGIPYGIPWGKLNLKFTVTLVGLEKSLHNAGVWTLEDLMKHPQAVLGALQDTYRLDYAALLSAASDYQRQED